MSQLHYTASFPTKAVSLAIWEDLGPVHSEFAITPLGHLFASTPSQIPS